MAVKSGQKVAVKSGQTRYGKIPLSVLCDGELSASARCVYAYLAVWVFQGRTARIGQRKIATDLAIHRDTVARSITELVDRKHLTAEGRSKTRRVYILESDVFARKQGKEDVIASSPRGRRLVSVDMERIA